MTKLLVKQTNEFNGQLEIAVGIVIKFLASSLTGRSPGRSCLGENAGPVASHFITISTD
jgi:hypothetical protein